MTVQIKVTTISINRPRTGSAKGAPTSNPTPGAATVSLRITNDEPPFNRSAMELTLEQLPFTGLDQLDKLIRDKLVRFAHDLENATFDIVV